MKESKYFTGPCQTPLGILLVTVTTDAVVSVRFAEDNGEHTRVGTSPLLEQAVHQIEEYFQGERREFDLPLDLSQGTEFQKVVWQDLMEIPFGEKRSYAELAVSSGSKGAARAVGAACSRNPLLLLVPCHRVLGSDGSLTGFAAGVEMKKWLLDHESSIQTVDDGRKGI